jgi:hypothetical protein
VRIEPTPQRIVCKRLKCPAGPIAEIDFIQAVPFDYFKIHFSRNRPSGFECSLEGAAINRIQYCPTKTIGKRRRL